MWELKFRDDVCVSREDKVLNILFYKFSKNMLIYVWNGQHGLFLMKSYRLYTNSLC